jgi:ubiquinone/menaquinone biosynthesis C-methylase UbiE
MALQTNDATRYSIDISRRRASIVAGLGLLLMAVLAPIANSGAVHNLTVTGNPVATSSNILSSMALDRLHIAEGETVLEVGFGTGHCLKRMAESVGKTGKACAIDISSGMLEIARKRLRKAGLIDRVELHRGDAMEMPFHDDTFDAAFSSFTLELFDTPEIPKVLGEIRRVLKPKARFGIVSMSKQGGGSIPVRLYEWFHEKSPKYADCRPIYVAQSLRDAGFEIRRKERVILFGLPGEIVVAGK